METQIESEVDEVAEYIDNYKLLAVVDAPRTVSKTDVSFLIIPIFHKNFLIVVGTHSALISLMLLSFCYFTFLIAIRR